MIEASFLYRKQNFTLNVNLKAPDTGITVIAGPSAAGKTTILKLMAGIVSPQKGGIVVSGNVWSDTDRSINLPPSARNCGYVFQEGRLFPHLNVENNLRYGLKRSGGRGKIHLTFDGVTGMLGLGNLLRRDVLTLSGGQRQRVAIGRALLSQPDMLLMDEPLSSLDEEAKADLIGLVQRAIQESRIPTFYVSHSQDEMVALADHVIYVKNGGVSFQGTLSDALLHPNLPYIYREELCSVVEGSVIEYDDVYHLSTFMTALGPLKAPSHPLSGKYRLVLHARDISLSYKNPDSSSISNHFTGIIIGIEESETPSLIGTVRVVMEINGIKIAALITKKSAASLGLNIGKHVHAQVKAISLKAIAQSAVIPATDLYKTSGE